MSSLLFKGLNFYNYSLWKYPLRTSCCTAGTIYACGDYVCQVFIERNKERWDAKKEGCSYWRPKFDRIAKMTVVGFLINGPFAKFWYHDVQPYYIREIIPRIYKPFKKKFTNWQQAFVSSFIDTFIVNWPYFGLMIILTGIIESGGSFMDGVHKVKAKLPETMAYSWCIWPLWVVCLYGIIPKYVRAPADNLFDAMWAVFFSWL